VTQLPDAARRRFLARFVYGAGYLGLRSLATGLPISLLAQPRAARAADDFKDPQFLVLNTSQAGDPLNCNAPGTYLDAGIAHPSDPRMQKTSLLIGGAKYDAAAPWATLAPAVLERTSFLHHATGTEQHLAEPDVLGLMGSVAGKDMLVSALAARLAPVLDTVQPQPISIGTSDSSEAILYRGRPQPLLNPKSLSQLLGAPGGMLGKLQSLRDRDLDALNALYKQEGNAAQRRFLDDYATSQTQVRKLSQDLLTRLSAIKDNGPDSQLQAAIILVQLKVAPVITVHIPFGGDNHFDGDLSAETSQTLSGVASINAFLTNLGGAGLTDKVTFASFNVFGRTLKMKSSGRSHNRNHHVTLLVGKRVKGSVIGGVTPLADDYGAAAFSSGTGAVDAKGDVTDAESLASVGKTLGCALGVPADQVDATVVDPSSGQSVGKIIRAALVS
jgi:hypothetical protein